MLCRSGFYFTNVLCAALMYVSCARSFLCLRFRFVLYRRKTVGAKAVCRMLVRLILMRSIVNKYLDVSSNAMLHLEAHSMADLTVKFWPRSLIALLFSCIDWYPIITRFVINIRRICKNLTITEKLFFSTFGLILSLI